MVRPNSGTSDERSSPAVRGVVLAGGRSTRFDGGNKALAELDGRPLVDHAVRAVAAATDGVPLLSVADDSQAERSIAALGADAVETVRDDESFSGPLAGVFAAASATEAPWLFVCGCDMPLVSPESVDALWSVLARESQTDQAETKRSVGEDVDAVVPVVDERDQPMHALYRRRSLEAVRETVADGDGPMTVLDAFDGVNRVEADDVDAIATAATTNVNTRTELEALRDVFDER